MLRINVHGNGTICRLELAGRLAGPWVVEMENAWRSARSSSKDIDIDLRAVTGIDNAGRDLLASMHRSGARLIAKGLWMNALVDQITGEMPFDGTKRPPRTGNVHPTQSSQIRRNSK